MIGIKKALAGIDFGKMLASAIDNPIGASSFSELLERIANFLYTLAIYILPIVIVGAGLFWITSSGNPEQAEKGKKILTYSLIGFVVILVAKGLISLLKKALGM